MKIRNGFVSNSSSSSFIVIIPDSFDINTVDISDYTDEYKVTKASIKKGFKELKKDSTLYEDDDYDVFYVLTQILGDYIVAQIESGSGLGEIINLDRNEIMKVLSL